MFKPNGPIGRFLSALLDQLTLNIFYTICCLPVITIGAATAALYSAQFAIAEDTASGVIAEFWAGFRRNWKQATPLFLIAALVGVLLGGALYAAVIQGLLGSAVTVILAALVLLAFTGTVSWLFPLVARYEQKTGTQLYNAYALSVAKLPVTILMVVLNYWWIPALLAVPMSLMGSYLFIVTFCAAAIASYVNCRLILRVLSREE